MSHTRNFCADFPGNENQDERVEVGDDAVGRQYRYTAFISGYDACR